MKCSFEFWVCFRMFVLWYFKVTSHMKFKVWSLKFDMSSFMFEDWSLKFVPWCLIFEFICAWLGLLGLWRLNCFSLQFEVWSLMCIYIPITMSLVNTSEVLLPLLRTHSVGIRLLTSCQWTDLDLKSHWLADHAPQPSTESKLLLSAWIHLFKPNCVMS